MYESKKLDKIVRLDKSTDKLAGKSLALLDMTGMLILKQKLGCVLSRFLTRNY